jgi:hypothetical protein
LRGMMHPLDLGALLRGLGYLPNDMRISCRPSSPRPSQPTFLSAHTVAYARAELCAQPVCRLHAPVRPSTTEPSRRYRPCSPVPAAAQRLHSARALQPWDAAAETGRPASSTWWQSGTNSRARPPAQRRRTGMRQRTHREAPCRGSPVGLAPIASFSAPSRTYAIPMVLRDLLRHDEPQNQDAVSAPRHSSQARRAMGLSYARRVASV